MKRFLTALMTVSAIFALSSCKENNPVEELDGPVIEWPANSSFATVDITGDLDASLTVTAEAGISALTVEVQSDLLAAALQVLGITDTELDFINDKVLIGAFAMIDPNLPTGDRIFNQTEVDFNISALVQMINSLTMEDGNHTFVINVTDNNGKTAEATCTFHRVGVSAPSVEWPSNPDFAVMDITEDLDASLTVSAAAGIKGLTVEVQSEIMESALAALGITTTTLDLVNDQTVIGILNVVTSGALPTGEALLNQTEVDFNISALVQMINIVTTEDSNHTFVVKVTDNADRTAEATCTFHRVGVPGPSVEWPSNPDFATVDITADLDATLTVNAPAGIRTFTVSVDSESLAPMLAVIGLSSEMDLINDPNVVASLGMMGIPTGDQLLDQTSVEFNITTLVALIPELAGNGTEHSFTLAITDNNGAEFSQTCTFRVVK